MSLSVGNHQIWIKTKANWSTKTPSEVVVALVIPQWTCTTTRAPVVLTKQKEFVTGKSKREFPTRALSFDKIDLFLRKHNMGWDWKALDSRQSQPSGGKVCFKLSSWVLLFSKGISATLRTGKRNNFPKMLRVESGTTGTANFVRQGEIFFCFSKVRESLWFKLRLRHVQHSAAISYMNIFWTSNQL